MLGAMQNVKLQQKTLYSDKFLLHTNNSNADHYATSATEMVQMILRSQGKGQVYVVIK